jgi:Trk K+ transport system NAD-binding subunit
MFDQRLAERVRRGFDINTAFSTSQLAAPALAAASTRAAVDYSFYVKDVLLNVSQVTVASGSPLVGETLGGLEEELDISTILHCNDDAMNFHPAPELILQGGDQIVVFATLESLARLNQMNQSEDCSTERRGPRAWFDRWRQRRKPA